MKYFIVGGHACILHGHIRTTENVDVLVEDSLENFQRTIDALSKLEDHAAAELRESAKNKYTNQARNAIEMNGHFICI